MFCKCRIINAESLRYSTRWTSGNTAVATVNSSGVITAVSEGVTTVTFSYKYFGVEKSASTKVYVGEKNWNLYLGTAVDKKVESLHLTVGKAVQLNVYNVAGLVNDKRGYAITYHNSNPDVISMMDGLLYAKQAGTSVLSVTVTDKVTGVQRTLKVEVKAFVEITIQEKLDYFLEKIEKIAQEDGTVYFTVNKQACKVGRGGLFGHGNSDNPCSNDNCLISNVIKASWFKELFGELNSVGLFPRHAYSATGDNYNGYSCFGFACFLQWYLYADTIDEEQFGDVRVEEFKFNKENVKKYAKPGDSIRVNGHSFIVYEVQDDGIMAVDCNWDIGNGNCAVEKHLVPYDHEKYAGYTAYVDRVKKVADLEEGMAGLYLGK